VRIFVYEHITGGGLAGEPLPAGLTREADLMVQALLTDLAGIAGVEVLASRDPRLAPLSGVDVLNPGPGESFLALYERGLADADAAWPTAPETGGILEQLCRRTLARDRVLLGSRPEAVSLTASKSATIACLRDAGIPVPPTFTSAGAVPARLGPWIVKPDDGAGCEDTVRVPHWRGVRDLLAREPGRLIAEPWIEGDALSLSMIAARGRGVLLCCNRQRVRVVNGRLALTGLQVNAWPDTEGRLAALAARIADAVPSLWGYVGVDLVLSAGGPVVLEINPRLTTSYAGIRRALDVNVAAMVLGLLDRDDGAIPRRPDGVTAVEVALETSGGH
jgi:predicted ATP-grasp superfamily ATP-dependent carboligase